ncbi:MULTISPECIES: hypothetical protein [Pseudonocardia]|nr:MULTISPECIES: hypothetical protein [Pseudonocardia]
MGYLPVGRENSPPIQPDHENQGSGLSVAEGAPPGLLRTHAEEADAAPNPFLGSVREEAGVA